MTDDPTPGQPVNPVPPPAQSVPPQQMMPPPGYGQPYQQAPQNDIMQSIIPTSNPPALWSYYCGIFSWTIIFAPILSPIAIVSGVKGMKRIKAQPGLKGYGHALAGIIMGSFTGLIFLVIVGALFFSAASQPDTGPIKRPAPRTHTKA